MSAHAIDEEDEDVHVLLDELQDRFAELYLVVTQPRVTFVAEAPSERATPAPAPTRWWLDLQRAILLGRIIGLVLAVGAFLALSAVL